MKLLGFSCGRKMQNTEVLVKEALMAAEELGVEGELLRMLDLDIRPCRLCKTCLSQQKGPEACVIKDDAAFLYDKFMDCDGLILGAPVYILTPPGYLKMIGDRVLGPKVGAGTKERAKAGGIDPSTGRKTFVDERIFKSRVGAFISVGGASTLNWLSFGLPLLHTITFSPQVTIVDQMQVLALSLTGPVVMNDEALARARRLGRNVAEAMSKPIGEAKWMSDEPGTCPVCHSNLLTVTNKNPVECPICGISGTIKVDGDKITVTFSKKEQARSRLKYAGILEHAIEILENTKILMQKPPNPDELAKRLNKYKSYKPVAVPPSRARKRPHA